MNTMRLSLIFLFLFLVASSCVSYNQKVLLKRDRYGESPVVDMRSGTSALEYGADETEKEEKKERK